MAHSAASTPAAKKTSEDLACPCPGERAAALLPTAAAALAAAKGAVPVVAGAAGPVDDTTGDTAGEEDEEEEGSGDGVFVEAKVAAALFANDEITPLDARHSRSPI